MASIAISLGSPNAAMQPARYLAGATSRQLSWSMTLGIVGFGLALLMPFLGTSRTLTYHEVVYAEPAREMLTTGDFVLPRIAGVPFTDKPPLMAWAIAASMTLFQSQSEWIVRLPSVAAAIGTAWILAALCTHWFSRRIGLFAALVQLTTVHVLMQAKLAEADTLLALATAGAMACFGLAHVEGQHGRLTAWWMPSAFYACVAGSFLAKFMAGPALILAGCGLFLVVQRNLRGGLRFLFNPLGIAVFLLMTVPWLVAAYLKYPAWLDNVLFHNFGRFGGAMGSNERSWAYFYLVPMMMLPWTPMLFIGLINGLRRGLYLDQRWQLLGCWFLGGMALLSWMAFKTKHYPIPVLTPLAAIAAAALVDHLAWRTRVSWQWTLGWCSVAVAGSGIGMFAVSRAKSLGADQQAAIMSVLALVAAGMVIVFLLEHQRQVTAQVATLFGTIVLAAVVVQAQVMPFHDSYRHQTEFSKLVNAAGPRDGRVLTLVGLPDNQITYYLHAPLRRFDEPAEFFKVVAGGPGAVHWVLGPAWFEAMLKSPALAQSQVTGSEAEILAQCSHINRYQTWNDRLTLFRWAPGRE